MTPIDRRRLEHAAALIDHAVEWYAMGGRTPVLAELELAAEKIRVTLAPEIGDEPDEPFRVLGSRPAPQVDVIDGETA